MRALEDSLGIAIITYNRAERLDRTLAALLAGPFANCRITVLDNSSSDHTPDVCARFATRFPQMRVVRHRVNIGLSANYLRAVELSDLPYTWVLGDDDELDTTDVTDIVDAIRSDKPDLVIVGAVNQPRWSLGRFSTARELLQLGFPYFYVTGWITGVVFRTADFDSESFYLGYKNADNVFPHFPFYAKAVDRNATVYVARRWIAGSRQGGEYGRLGSVMLAGWMHSARFLDDSQLRRAALLQGPVAQGQRVNYAGAALTYFKAFGIHSVVQRRTLGDTWLKAFAVSTWDVRAMMLPSGIHLLLPGFAARGLWRLSQMFQRRPDRRIDGYAAALDEART